MRVEHFNNAEKQGRAAARAMLGDVRPYDDIHRFWSDQYEHKLEYVGSPAPGMRSWGIMKAALRLNRGGDPELGDGELRSYQEMIRARNALPVATLADDRVELQALAAAAGGSRGRPHLCRATKPAED